MMHDNYIKLLYESLSGNISPPDKEKLKQWRLQSTDNEHIAKDIEEAWTLSGHYQTNLQVDLDKEYADLKQKMRPTPKVVKMKTKPPYLKYAAVAITLLVSSFLLYQFLDTPPQNWEVVEADNIQSIELVDGSIVWLNKGSKLEYTAEFGAKRVVKLEGEGFFDVAENPEKPFLVQTPNVEVKVLGTSFNVSEIGDTVMVFVRTGKVNMRPLHLKKGIDLKPLDKAIFSIPTKKITRLLDAKSNDDAWQSGKLIYDNDRLMDIANGLTNYYGKEFIIADEALEKCRFTFTFDNKNLSEVVQILEESVGFVGDERSDYVVLERGRCPQK